MQQATGAGLKTSELLC